MAKRTKDIYSRKRKPVITLICEGRNQTETKYFKHFNKRENPYTLKIISSEATDPKSMIKKAKQKIAEMDLDNSIGDRVFCLIDLDLSQDQLNKIEEEKSSKSKKKCCVEFILSNPCFEVWLLYYFVEFPKVVNSSQKVKEQLKKYVPNYSESFDIVKECGLEEKYAVAINRAEKSRQLNKENSMLDKNPYTEVPDLLVLLLDYPGEQQ